MLPTIKEMSEEVAARVLDEYIYEGKTLRQWIEALVQSEWIPVSERLPENANHLGAFCPRYRISSAKYGVTEGWYNPDMGTWYGLIWQLTPGNIDMERGDIPAVIRMIDVTAWMELPEPYKAESEALMAEGEIYDIEHSPWTPISMEMPDEELPEDFQRVLITVVNYAGDKVVRVASCINPRRMFRVEGSSNLWEVGEKGLLAWMPLPEPYKAESEGEG